MIKQLFFFGLIAFYSILYGQSSLERVTNHKFHEDVKRDYETINNNFCDKTEELDESVALELEDVTINFLDLYDLKFDKLSVGGCS